MASAFLTLSVLALVITTEVDCLSCAINPHNVCLCDGVNFTLDLGAAFSQRASVNISSKYNPGESFVISPCVDYDCGGVPSRVCEWDAQSEVYNVIGTAEEVIWNVASIDKFSVTFGKGAPIYNAHIRNARICCTTGKPEYSFDGEGDPNTDNPLVYRFSVQAESFNPPMPVPSPSPTPPTPFPDSLLMYIILVILAMVLGLLLLLTALVLVIVRKIYSTPAATVSGLKYKQLEPHDT